MLDPLKNSVMAIPTYVNKPHIQSLSQREQLARWLGVYFFCKNKFSCCSYKYYLLLAMCCCIDRKFKDKYTERIFCDLFLIFFLFTELTFSTDVRKLYKDKLQKKSKKKNRQINKFSYTIVLIIVHGYTFLFLFFNV